MNNKFIVNVSVVIFNNKTDVLLCHRSPNEDVFPNLWGIPGGKIDHKDTTLEEGLRREVREEVGIEIKNITLISNNIRSKSDSQNVIYLVYKSYILTGSPKPLEDTDEVKWVQFKKIDPSVLTPFTYKILKRVINNKIKKTKNN